MAVRSRLLISLLLMLALCQAAPSFGSNVQNHITFFGSIPDRSSGSEGCKRAANYILDTFHRAGLISVGVQDFFLPIPEVKSASIKIADRDWRLYPWGPNMATLPKTPESGLSGRLIYAGDGSFVRFNGHRVEGAIVLMDMASYQNWLNAAILGAKALIFIGNPRTTRIQFKEKNTPTPLAFPRFWVPAETGEELKTLASKGQSATVFSDTHWTNKIVRNIYGIVEGTDRKLKDELVVIEAPYDASSYILGYAPGADEATSISILLAVAESLARHPAKRSVMFVATTGHGQGLAGMREFMWSATARSKDLRKEKRYLKHRKRRLDQLWKLTHDPHPLDLPDAKDQDLVWQFIVEKAKDAADYWTRERQYQAALELRGRSSVSTDHPPVKMQSSAASTLENPRPYRRLSWHLHATGLTPEERELAKKLLQDGITDLAVERRELKQRRLVNQASIRVKRLVRQFTPVLFLSLSLSSQSVDCGLSEWGNTYPLKDRVTRQRRTIRLAEILNTLGRQVSRQTGISNLIYNTSSFINNEEQQVATISEGFPLASDVAAIAERPAVSLVSVSTERFHWSTPRDQLHFVNRTNLDVLARFLSELIPRLCSHPRLNNACRNGYRGLSSIRGQAMFMRQGELFADQPAPGTIISAIQGTSIFRTMVFRDGTFFLTGIASKKVAFQKVILEPYGLDPITGRVAWTADKIQTGKSNYRIKVKSRVASTALVMFHCEQTDVIGTFDPQKLGYLTKVKLLDGVTEARPLRFWYSRVDGRDTMAISILLEKGTRFKLILSDTLLRKVLLLINSTRNNPMGFGYLIGPPDIILTPLKAAQDLYFLLGQRLENLSSKGIVNRYLQDLYQATGAELTKAKKALDANQYNEFWHNVVTAWAKLDRIYGEVESTQRDVLTGVMFFIALFVPFAYCLERYLFCFRSIYQQVVAFFIILTLTIFTIRGLHPAFQLTYNPTVVIIAFFIVGLSLLVSWIIFTRFEREMAESRSRHELSSAASEQVNKWQAFGAGFAIGASNLNRRKLRTALTCVTLIILTFTVMSFTNVKSLRKTTRTLIGDQSVYHGVLLHHQIWRPLTLLSVADMRTRFGARATIWPRAWVEPVNPFDRIISVLRHNNKSIGIEGILGVGANPPKYFEKIIQNGRWFRPQEHSAILISRLAARALGLDPAKDVGARIQLWSTPFKVVGYFDSNQLEKLTDLDGLRITPAYLEMPADQEISEVEVEAMQSGEEITPMTERFHHARASLTAIIPYGSCINLGGKLKAISILPRVGQDPLKLANELSQWLVYPLFVGDHGTWYHSASRTLRYQGAANIIVPILIVICICLNTMIGHVQERQKEIGVYTSVGLAPTHVGFLFIVEAMSLAVLSTVSGYILAQMTAKYLSDTALFSQLTFNYSSLASVACMFLVFSVVFLASLYPARVAARIAMPDVTRTWKLPEPEGDMINVNLPFLLKTEEETGIMNFFRDFFAAHQDISHGTFIVNDARLDYDSPTMDDARMPSPVCISLRADVWLAPFDFGIKQRVQLYCCPSEINPGYLEISLRLVRMSGENSAWVRTNKGFVKAIRKQMLMWRLLDLETKRKYLQPA